LIAQLPVGRSTQVRYLFLGTAVVGCLLVMWMQQLRHMELPGLSPVFKLLFVRGDYAAALLMPVVLIVAAFVPARDWVMTLLRAIGSSPFTVAALVTATLCAGALDAYLAHPLSMDEYSPFLQSQAFAAGALAGHYPPDLIDWLVPHENQNTFLSVSHDSGAIASNYWPGLALLLTPFTLLGIPWACNPVLSGLTVFALQRLAMRLFDDVQSAGLVMLLTIASPVFFADGISFYSMTAHLLCNVVFVLLVLDATPRRLLLAGLTGSLALTLHNPVPHLLFALPWLWWLFRRPDRARTLPWLILGYLPLCLLLGVGWFWYARTWLHRGPIDQAVMAAIGQTAGFAYVFGLPNEWTFLARLIGIAKVWLWAVPGLLLFAGLGYFRQRHNSLVRLLAASAALTFFGYFFVLVDQGHGWGYRYFHSAWFVLPLLAAAAVAPVASNAPVANGAAAGSPDLRAFIAACALLYLPVGILQRASDVRDFVSFVVGQAPAHAGPGPRVIFIDPRRMFYGADLIQNDAFLRDDQLRLMWRSPVANAALMARFRPDYRRVLDAPAGEVWAPPAAAH
jgi:hypothetical protein